MNGQLLRDIETPAEVTDLLEGLRGHVPARDFARLERDFKMSYLFGGLEVAYFETKHGPSIVASGPICEVEEVVAKLEPKQLRTIHTIFPEDWELIVDAYDRSPGAAR